MINLSVNRELKERKKLKEAVIHTQRYKHS